MKEVTKEMVEQFKEYAKKYMNNPSLDFDFINDNGEKVVPNIHQITDDSDKAVHLHKYWNNIKESTY